MSGRQVFVPVAIALEPLAPERHLPIFLASALAILPLAGWMGRATGQLAQRTGEGIGGLLNARFGNALLVLGAAMLAGGIGGLGQRFKAKAARSQATMLIHAVIALIVPSACHLALVSRIYTSRSEAER